MAIKNQVLAIDLGNTAIKIALIIDDEINELSRFRSLNDKSLIEYLNRHKETPKVLSSVLSDASTQLFKSEHPVKLHITHGTSFPIQIGYETPGTLGLDRICNAIGGSILASTHTVVTIDIGTCIKFDIIENGMYLGGSISPGIDLRYKSLNDYTGKLPLVSNKNNSNLVGTSTNSSISSGVLNGMQAEIQGMINQYEQDFEDLTFFVTGGDAQYFDIHSKNDIFADENLTLIGLYEIYKHNA